MLAGLVDFVPSGVLVGGGSALAGQAGFVVGFVLMVAFFAGFEARGGQTPGKRLLGIRVRQLDGRPCGTLGAVLRNAFRIVDAFPGVYLIALVSIAGSRRKQRLGDQAAGTSVFDDRA